jgi:hypothetical protein
MKGLTVVIIKPLPYDTKIGWNIGEGTYEGTYKNLELMMK